jgi:hypothetical protein
VIQHDSIDAYAALREALCGAFVRAIDLEVMFKLSLAFQAIPERLTASLFAVTVTFKKAAAFLRERDGMVARTGHPNGFDQPLLAKMSKIARAWIGRTIVMISEITTGDHSKRTDGGERPRLRAAQGVLAIAVADDLSLRSTRQFQIAREWLARIDRAVSCVALAFGPPRIVTRISGWVVGIRLARVAWTPAQCSRVTVIAIARTNVERPQIVIAIEVVSVAPASAVSIDRRTIVVTIARVGAPARVVKHETSESDGLDPCLVGSRDISRRLSRTRELTKTGRAAKWGTNG